MSQTNSLYLHEAPVSLNYFNSRFPDEVLQTFSFDGYPDITIDICKGQKFGISALHVKINTEHDSDEIVQAIRWGDVVISLSKDGSVYIDGKVIYIDDSNKHPLVLINSKISVLDHKDIFNV